MVEEFYVRLGDWSGDGHSINETFIILLEGEFTTEQLAENYQKNVEKLKFDIKDIAEDYEDASIEAEQVTALQEQGFVFTEGIAEEHGFLDVKEYLNILMFFFTHGLEVTWSLKEQPKHRYLVGGGRSVAGNSFYGYGLYS